MSIRIGIPSGEIYEKIVGGFETIREKYDLQLLRADDEQLGSMFAAGNLDLAFLSPLSYSMGMGKAEYRIIPETCLALEGYTGAYSIYFNPESRSIKTLAAKSDTSYLTIAARTILAERYDAFPETKVANVDAAVSIAEILEKADVALIARKSHAKEPALDLSEQWLDSYEYPLMLGCWVCTINEEKPDEREQVYQQIVAEMASPDLESEVHVRDEFSLAGTKYSRCGNIHYRWSDDMETTMSETLQLLFVLRLYNSVPAVKVLGKGIKLFEGDEGETAPEETNDDHDHACDCEHDNYDK